MQAKENHILLLCILLMRASCTYSEQFSEFEQEAHNVELEIDEIFEEDRKERKIDPPIKTKIGPDTKND